MQPELQKLLKVRKWKPYLTRPFTLFGASLWQAWYGGQEAKVCMGTDASDFLFVEDPENTARSYWPEEQFDKFKKGREAVFVDYERTWKLLDEAAELNKQALRLIDGKESLSKVEDAIAFLVRTALRATVLPFWASQYYSKDKKMEERALALRATSYYPDIIEKVVMPLAKKRLQELGGNPEDINLLTYQELLAKDLSKIAQRREAIGRGWRYVYSIVDQKETVAFVPDANEVLKELQPELFVQQDIKGEIAFKGKAKGTVRIVDTFNWKTKTFDKGDILVSINSNPTYMPLIRKAGAIVTDEGGIMSHAAIVSRELKKPCVMGTRIATKVLKDRDIVEVDAEKGIVKILKRKTANGS